MNRTPLTVTAAALCFCGLITPTTLADEALASEDVLIEFAANPTAADVALVESVGGVVHQVWTVVPGLHATGYPPLYEGG